ncbi:MAG: hypothetical protein ACRD4L_04080, partial [Pyrinomonadaceae bacterium]
MATQPHKGTIADGRNHRSNAAYSRNASNVPQATLGDPGGHQMPKRSATADKNDNANATRNAI